MKLSNELYFRKAVNFECLTFKIVNRTVQKPLLGLFPKSTEFIMPHRQPPQYDPKEERINVLTHAFGFVLSMVGLVLLIVRANTNLSIRSFYPLPQCQKFSVTPLFKHCRPCRYLYFNCRHLYPVCANHIEPCPRNTHINYHLVTGFGRSNSESILYR